MLLLPKGLFFLPLTLFVCSAFAANETTYIAVVVEFDTKVDSTTAADRIAARQTKIVSIITATENSAADIIVFPEYALEEVEPQIVSDPLDRVVLCNNDTYSGPLKDVSCAAKQASTYVVLNVLTKYNCSLVNSANDTEDTTSEEFCIYNSNVVFDRTGAVISIYHKYHIYNEAINRTVEAESVFFDTDFNVKFGHLICFDILFEEPAASLLNKGVTNFVFPSKWNSELPFLTAIQLQQGWAQSAGVNLLAAGISDPAQGSTGSGIYSGAQGALKRQFSGTRRSMSLTSTVSKEPGQNEAVTPLTIPIVSPLVALMRDFISNYTIEQLLANDIDNHTELCYEDLCCSFDYRLKDVLGETQSVAYEYVAGVFSGLRPFGPDKEMLSVVNCAIFTCTDAHDIETCATLSPATSTVNRYQFQKLDISGQFRVTHGLVIPNTLTVGLVPLLTAQYKFSVSEAITFETHEYSNVTVSLDVFNQQLMTFGIWGREFSSSASQCTLITGLLLISTLVTYFF